MDREADTNQHSGAVMANRKSHSKAKRATGKTSPELPEKMAGEHP